MWESTSRRGGATVANILLSAEAPGLQLMAFVVGDVLSARRESFSGPFRQLQKSPEAGILHTKWRRPQAVMKLWPSGQTAADIVNNKFSTNC